MIYSPDPINDQPFAAYWIAKDQWRLISFLVEEIRDYDLTVGVEFE